MRNPFDTLFGRLALLTTGLIVLVHVTAYVAVNHERNIIDTEHARRDVMAALRMKEIDGADAAGVAKALGVRYIGAEKIIEAGCPAPCDHTNTPFDRDLLARLPAGSRVVSDTNGAVWVRYGSASFWLRLSDILVPSFHFFGQSAVTLVLALMLALVVAWQFQRPLRRLSGAARQFRSGWPTVPVEEGGPVEIRSLIADFNRMMHSLSLAEQERALLLAGIAHDLKAPITRMRLRVALMNDEERRTGFSRDAESLSAILAQFLEHAMRSSVAPSSTNVESAPTEGVDEHCRKNYGGSLVDEGLVMLDLSAGEAFRLPSVDLDRIVSNLFENAMSHGEVPVEISTRKNGEHYRLTVRDHGEGVPDDQIESVMQPFVRVNNQRAEQLHHGLGLAVVKRLACQNDGEIECRNAADGGFVVILSFPQ